MKKSTSIYLGLVLAMLCTASFAQSEKEGKIKVEITKEVDGEKRTFKGEYDSEEEMRADPNYQEFAGEDNDIHFFFDGGDDEQMFFRMDMLDNFKSHSFSFSDDGDDVFFFDLNDSTFDKSMFSVIDPSGLSHLSEELTEKLDDLGLDLETLLDGLDDVNIDDNRKTIVIELKKIKVTEVTGDEFGKKGKVSAKDKLKLADLSFYPNPTSNGRFKVKFSVPEEKELSIKVTDLQGKEVFSRYFERFGGTYSETLDLSGQKEGIYLLEICQGKKRETKKIIVK